MNVRPSLMPLARISMAAALIASPATSASACTGIRLVAADGSAVYGCTLDWGAFDLNSRVAIIPKSHSFAGQTPEGTNGKSWTAEYGVVALADGMNESGLAVGIFYHPGFDEFPEYDPAEAARTIGATDVVAYLLTQFSTIDEVKAALEEVHVVGVAEALVGVEDPPHWKVTEPSGRSIVVEYAGGNMRFFDNPLGVITNAPTCDWHMTNLRNYLSQSAVALPTRSIDEMDFAPRRGQRHVRTARRQHAGFALCPGCCLNPDGATDCGFRGDALRGAPHPRQLQRAAWRRRGFGYRRPRTDNMRSSTTWTTVWDLKKKLLLLNAAKPASADPGG
jgi:choloylglycine hydrolase